MIHEIGIDVSEHQPNIDWTQVKEHIHFAILRASHGTQSPDKSFEKHYAGATSLQLTVGAYHYYYYGDQAKFREETQNFIRCIQGKTFPLGVYLDLEEQGEYIKDRPLSSLGKKIITDLAIEALDLLAKAGHRPGIYANSYWFKNYIDTTRLPSSTLIWCADTSGKLQYPGKVDIHQYDFYGSVAGIPGHGLDMNRVLTDVFDQGAISQPIPPTPTGNLTVDGILGGKTIRRLQAVLGTPEDGVIGQPVSKVVQVMQEFLNSTVSPGLLQQYCGGQLQVDGRWGSKTTKGLQCRLYFNDEEPFCSLLGRKPNGKDIDGIPGPVTYKLLQTKLNQATTGAGHF